MMAQTKKTTKKASAKKAVQSVVAKKAPAKKKVTRKAANQAAKKIINKVGRPTLYRPEFCQALIDHFDVEPNREVTKFSSKSDREYTVKEANPMPTFGGFAQKIKVGAQTILDWSKVHPDFESAVQQARASSENYLIVNALADLISPAFALFVCKNYTGLRDIKEVLEVKEISIPESPVEIEKRIAVLNKDIERLKAKM